MTENLPEVLSADEAIEAVRQLRSLQEILTAPQRQHMADMALWWQEEHGRRQDAYVRETARAIGDTFRNVQALGPDVGSILRRVAKRRFEMARIAASVERKNWVAEYRQRTEVQYAMENALNDMRAIHAWPNPFLPPEVTEESLRDVPPVKPYVPEFWRRG